ncbi:ExbD/TolR family protein [Teredinibacter waterburyi]|uniref:ExbD/TolR family protein n=1 Tax=Teredinibacter waterburyi TaxID=1500538 RepID=UPI00165FF1B4|nr:biopolymer transporter ExbD [Teredinibacter waterburyi]
MKLLAVKSRSATDDNMIPLINIVFLLLIFFMIAGKISSSEAVYVEPPLSSRDTPLIEKPLVVLVDENGEISIGGEAIDIDGLEQRLKTITQEEKSDVSVKADKNLSVKKLQIVLHKLQAQGVANITLYAKVSGRN